MDDKILHAIPKRNFRFFRSSRLADQALTNNLGLRDIAGLGVTGDFSKKRFWNFNGKRFHANYRITIPTEMQYASS